MKNKTVVIGGKEGALTKAIAVLIAESFAQGIKPIVIVDDLPNKEHIDLMGYSIKNFNFEVNKSRNLSGTSYKKPKKVDKRFTALKKKRKK